VSDLEALTRDRFQIVAFQLLTRCEGNRMHQAIQAVPVLLQVTEHRIYLRIVSNVARQDD